MSDTDFINLSLPEAIQLAEKQNLDIRISKINDINILLTDDVRMKRVNFDILTDMDVSEEFYKIKPDDWYDRLINGTDKSVIVKVRRG